MTENIPNDLSKYSIEELEIMLWKITEDTYQKTKLLREETWKRIQQDKEQENLKKAS